MKYEKRRGRIPIVLMKAVEILKPCQGYEKGKSINHIARELYGYDDMFSKIKARQQIARIRRIAKKEHIDNLWIYSMKPMGMPINMPRRYFHLQQPEEFKKVLDKLRRINKGINESEIFVNNGKKKTEDKIKEKEKRRKILYEIENDRAE